MNIWKPHAFQGHLKKKQYFEGWYYKIVDPKNNLAFCLIPGVALDGEKLGFIQYADTLTGQSGFSAYPLDVVDFSKDTLSLQLGDQRFTDKQISLLQQSDFPYSMSLTITPETLYPVSWHHPGIMGPFGFVPNMACNHGVYMMAGKVTGDVVIGGQKIHITSGDIYIEKDWGTSFPSAWVWLQGSHFEEDVHVMLSIANVPWMKSSFNGHLGYVFIKGQHIKLGTYAFSTYTLDDEEGVLVITVNKGPYHIVIIATQIGPIQLIAPVKGVMSREILEDLKGEISLEVYEDGDLIFEGKSKYCGIEKCGEIKTLRGKNEG